jgi:branched-chain amino acid transport system substrate-binding protein
MTKRKFLVDRRALMKQTAGVVAGALAAPMIGRAGANTIKIGMQSILSGRVAQLGTSTRNAVMLEVERINSSGGLAGRMIEMVIRVRRGSPRRPHASHGN